MAVTTQIYNGYAQYYDGYIGGCVGGGEDYRTVGKGETVQTYLYCLVDMSGLSSACRVSNVKVEFQSRYTLSTNTAGTGNYNVQGNTRIYYKMPTISGTQVNTNSGAKGSIFARKASTTVKSSSSYGSYSMSGAPANSATETIYGGSRGMVCANFPLSHNGVLNCRIWLNAVKFIVTRTRACYITFNGEGVSTTKTMYDYGATPSYNGTPKKVGYVFSGWKSSANNTVYSGTLPKAGEVDVTYTAQFTPITYTVKYVDNGGTITTNATFGQAIAARAIRDKNITITYSETSSRGKTENYTLSVRGWKDNNSIIATNGNSYNSSTVDAPYYANTYADLYNAFGYDKLALVNHYINYGINEGRKSKPQDGEPCGVYYQDRELKNLSTTQGQTITLDAVYDAVLVTIGDISKSGYIFKGWQSPYHTELLQPGALVSFSASATLTAVWEEAKTNQVYLGNRKVIDVLYDRANNLVYFVNDYNTAPNNSGGANSVDGISFSTPNQTISGLENVKEIYCGITKIFG